MNFFDVPERTSDVKTNTRSRSRGEKTQIRNSENDFFFSSLSQMKKVQMIIVVIYMYNASNGVDVVIVVYDFIITSRFSGIQIVRYC